ncbi:unnamed protein product [Tilletia controversa]|uniref:EF-hand domain-containing protein n=3 Tax=Tilletia TaxID=13289 RepID=A0A8X7MM05_9BASI|nr:hypothetical protein CF336_g6497 [Tilletia laevis]KAE8188019.1 hypothetical protein CF328_g6744 [Tilletia controversa]KAE8250263.1 hypothetical protein A4X03_0g6479 [Tilletia caries]KAE8189859.1 hypothetical protein CF335_g6512 [Tilletia laevis]KAE8241795.1 hypothetical protein A4X06_0g7399 [Tilletia controversa]
MQATSLRLSGRVLAGGRGAAPISRQHASLAVFRHASLRSGGRAASSAPRTAIGQTQLRVAGQRFASINTPPPPPPPPPASSAQPAQSAVFTGASSGSGTGGGGKPPRPRTRGLPLPRNPIIRYTLYTIGSAVFGLTVVVVGLLGYDAMTYRVAHIDGIPTKPLALNPRPGGPKNLPIVSDQVDDLEDDAHQRLSGKERLVIVGGGWAAVAVLQGLDPGKYNVTIVSPSNFFLFTPLLPSAVVGTVEPRSLVEPLRKIGARVKSHFILGTAVDVVMSEDPNKRLLEVSVISHADCVGDEGTGQAFQGRKETAGKHVYIPYDKLIVAVGSITSTHGVPGLENCFHLKTIQDGRAVRSRLMDNLEIAALPTTTPEERKRLLSFVVCGGGPTGVETASEIHDMINEDVLEYFPKLLRAEAQVHVIQSREHILNTYSEKISKYAESKFLHDDVDVITNARVKRVEADKVIYTIKDEQGNVTEKELPSGFTLWSTGIAMSPFTRRLTEILPNQSHLKAVQVDSHLRVSGAPLGTVYALGDACTIDNQLIDHLYEFVDKCDTDRDNALTFTEFEELAATVGKKFPLASKHFEKLRDTFDRYDKDKDGTLNLNEIADMFMETSSKMTALPATAQVASQQGKYLARKLNKLARVRDAHKEIPDEQKKSPGPRDLDDAVYRPFTYRNLGSLAYIGNAAAFDLPLPEPIGSFAGGLAAMYAWRSFYLSEQVSMRTRALLMMDWIKRGIWGRDLSRI